MQLLSLLAALTIYDLMGGRRWTKAAARKLTGRPAPGLRCAFCNSPVPSDSSCDTYGSHKQIFPEITLLKKR